MTYSTAIFVFLLLLFAGCQSPTSHHQKPVTAIHANSHAQVSNNIILEQRGGIEVARAFLSDEKGSLLNPQNTVGLNEPVFLNLVIAQGWIAENGRVSIGASQTITTNGGEPVLSSSDLFAGSPPVAESAAAHLRLKTVIAEARKNTSEFVVTFRVWDKNSQGELVGSYGLRLLSKGRR